MAYTFISVHPERFQNSALEESVPADSLIAAAQCSADQNVPESIMAIKNLPKYSLEAEWHPELHESGFQWHLSKVLAEGHDIFLQLPRWLDTLPVDEALEGMYKAVTLLYLVSAGEPEERSAGNFIVLHLITSLWGGEQVCCCCCKADP
ncbi:MAG: hypothetical protein HC767_06520 [Akkermansiaceae bacterium]|nr:hypothetical protein [Akkermansiaceae bacterium]